MMKKQIAAIMFAGVMAMSFAVSAQAGTGSASVAAESTATAGFQTADEAAKSTAMAESQPNGNSSESTTIEEDDTQNPVMNYIGHYGANRATIVVEASGRNDAKISVTWGGSAWETAEWEMTGTFDDASTSVKYDNCVKKELTYEEDGNIASEKVIYDNGKGTIRFEKGDLFWDDETEHVADGIRFQFFNPYNADDEAEMDEELAAALEGTWYEKNDGARIMEITPKEGGLFEISVYDGTGRDGEINIFTMTATFDMNLAGLTYNDGSWKREAITGEETESSTAPEAESTDDTEGVEEKSGGVIYIDESLEGDGNYELNWSDEKLGEELTSFHHE